MTEFSSPLLKGRWLKRYKRFFVDVVLESGETVTAHCPNTGSMKTCFVDDCPVYLSKSDNPHRKLAYTLELTEPKPGVLCGVNTHLPNKIIKNAIEAKQLFPEYSAVKSEVKYGKNSRIDLLLSHPDLKSCYLEIKNTTMLDGDNVSFPDAITERGQKHLDELVQMVREQNRAVLIFFVNRGDGLRFCPASKIDKIYAEKLRWAIMAGLEVYAYRAAITMTGIGVGNSIEVQS